MVTAQNLSNASACYSDTQSCLSEDFYAPKTVYPQFIIQEFVQKFIARGVDTQAAFCLFLDIDGTLSEFHDDPTQSFIPKNTLAIIQQIINSNVPVVAVTGRSIKVTKQLFKPLSLGVAGLHGLEIELDTQTKLFPDLNNINFEQIRKTLQSFCADYPQLLLEDKTHSFALHYRQQPEFESVAKQFMHQLLIKHPLMKLNDGKCVIEILPQQADKGSAINTILQQLNIADVLPIFIGDDTTDESGFITINKHQGLSIKVGAGKTQAKYRLQDVAAVTNFLDQFKQLLNSRILNSCVLNTCAANSCVLNTCVSKTHGLPNKTQQQIKPEAEACLN